MHINKHCCSHIIHTHANTTTPATNATLARVCWCIFVEMLFIASTDPHA